MHETKLAEPLGHRVIAKISWRILPLILLSYMVAVMDRANISYASVQMNASLGFSAAVYGLGAGVFFIGYSLFEIPSNLLLVRFGARRWIARIMLTWGLISGLMAFVQTPAQFYVMRFLLGVAEAGFYPGVLLYLSQWFPATWLCRAVSRFYIANPISFMVMGSIAGLLMSLDGALGVAGWQWMLLVEAIPALVIACLLLLYLPERIETTAWLSEPEKQWLLDHHAADHAASGAVQHDFWRTLCNPVVLGIGLTCALTFMCANALTYSTPKLLMQATGWSLGTVGYAAALANIPTVIAMLAVCWHSDYRRAPHYHIAAMLAIAAVGGLGMAWAFQAPAGQAVVSVLAAYCLFNAATTVVGPLTMPAASATLHPANRAVAFAAINTIAQVGNFLGPVLWGYAAGRTGSFQFGLNIVPFILLIPLGLILFMRRNRPRTIVLATAAA
ncbi:MFS transporter [Novosphingobium sp.]|uniref:MFS transporter n=1 Tax=Novosphingobium sp. TaxID=1874826 RepID=UPI00286DC431|nr:MFS transporter [Novosphingobium sp.]